MTPLALSGAADSVTGFHESGRLVLRLRDPKAAPQAAADAALIRGPGDAAAASAAGFATAVVIDSGLPSDALPDSMRAARLSARFGYFADGDIIGFDPNSRRLRTLYRRNSSHNSFLITERCNHYCLMCSQPPRNIDDGWILDEIASCVPLIDPATPSIGFTGGEPLLEWQRFIPLLARFRESLPRTRLHILTNGRFFADPQVVQAWAALKNPDLCAAIPVYSSVDAVHDHVVQARGALDETLHGILRLKDKRQRVEIRIVLHALTAPGLVETCRWLARNLPFVDHVALMALENTGFALANQEQLWIDPADYQDDLAQAVQTLREARMKVSIYNLPRCVLPRGLWDYAVQSISDWKNAFLPACEECTEKPQCGGFFSTGRPRFSRAVQPFHTVAATIIACLQPLFEFQRLDEELELCLSCANALNLLI